MFGKKEAQKHTNKIDQRTVSGELTKSSQNRTQYAEGNNLATAVEGHMRSVQ